MRLTVTGDQLLVASSGANRTSDDNDDLTSDKVSGRYQSSTLAQARAESGIRAQKKK